MLMANCLMGFVNQTSFMAKIYKFSVHQHDNDPEYFGAKMESL